MKTKNHTCTYLDVNTILVKISYIPGMARIINTLLVCHSRSTSTTLNSASDQLLVRYVYTHIVGYTGSAKYVVKESEQLGKELHTLQSTHMQLSSAL